MYVNISRGFRPSCKNCGASALRGFALRGFCPTTYINDINDFFENLVNKFTLQLLVIYC